MAVERNVEKVLGAVVHLPLRHWRPNMFFTGARDEELTELTQERFPKKPIKKKTHPIFSLKAIPANAGFSVCPCTSSRPYHPKNMRYVSKNCALLHTNYPMDRDSFLVEGIRFNIPPSVAFKLRFRGEVPVECLKKYGP